MSEPRSERHERLIRGVTVVSLAFSVIYITWRWGWTLNTEALWFSVPLVMAETYGLLTAFFIAFSAWRLRDRQPRPPLRGRTVDVFVTTYDEPLTIIRKTALAAREIHYPHATYILDDGHREEVRRLAAEIGVRYITRATNEHAKAGNLNNALANSSGEFILQLDADHVPLPQMIDRLIGFFADEKVAFAQSPQDFYNTDAFTYDVDVPGRRLWEDQQLFFRVLQPGKDRVNAAFFVGSCALVRRAALEEIGGFATATITEDIETSLLLHARGWKSVYLNETLAYGLAPSTALAFHVQHLRWGQGAMQTLKRYKPLRMPGLSLAQRFGYLDSLTTYLGGFQRLILYLAPLVFFTTGVFPLRATAAAFLTFFVPYLVLQLLSFKLLTRGHGSVLLADRFAMAKFFTHIMAITGYTTRRRLGFRVTPKDGGRVPGRIYAPQALLIGFTLAALGFAVYERTLGVAPEEVPGWGAAALWVNVAYALWNASVAAYIVRASLRGQHRRVEHRFAEALAVTLRIIRSDQKVAAYDIAITENLNPQGAALRCMHRIEEGSRVEMVLPLHWRNVSVRGRLVHHAEQTTPFGTVHVHGVVFDGIDAETRDAIELHCAQHATPMERQRYSEGASSPTGAFRMFRNLRHQPRLAVGMPVHISAGGNGARRSLGIGLLEDVSPHGARMLLDHPVAPGSRLRLEVPGSTVAIEGKVVFAHAMETSVGVRFVAGLETPMSEAAGPADAHWMDAMLATAARYGGAAMSRANAIGETMRRTMVATIAGAPASIPKAAAQQLRAALGTLAPSSDHTAVAAPEISGPDDGFPKRGETVLEAYAVAPVVEAAPADAGVSEEYVSEATATPQLSATAPEAAVAAAGVPDEPDSDEAATESYVVEARVFDVGATGAAKVDLPESYVVEAKVFEPDVFGSARVDLPESYLLQADVIEPVATSAADVRLPDSYVLEAKVFEADVFGSARVDLPKSYALEATVIDPGVSTAADAGATVATSAAPLMAHVPLSHTTPAAHSAAHAGPPAGGEHDTLILPAPPLIPRGDRPMQTDFGTASSRNGAPAILAIRGASARLEGKFDIEDSIEVQCDLSGELNVGGKLIIGESGTVSADVHTVDALILGTYSGNLVASGSIEIAATGRVSGTLESNELVIAKGGLFTGSVARAAQPAAATQPARSSAQPGKSRPAAAPEGGLAAGEADRKAAETPVPVVPTVADRDGEQEAPASKQAGRLQSITLS